MQSNASAKQNKSYQNRCYLKSGHISHLIYRAFKCLVWINFSSIYKYLKRRKAVEFQRNDGVFVEMNARRSPVLMVSLYLPGVFALPYRQCSASSDISFTPSAEFFWAG